MEIFNLSEYMRISIEQIISNAFKASLKNPMESAFLLQFTAETKKADRIRSEYEERGQHVPPFLIAGITSSCNLFCKGCYARENHSCGENLSSDQLSVDQWNDIFKQAEEIGVSFILLAGGEPLLRKDVVLAAAKHSKILFPIFTNGTVISDEYLQLFHKKRNLLPILSIEGTEIQTDERRGEGTYRILTDAMAMMSKKGIFYGVSITVTTQNLPTVTSDEYIAELYSKGCKLIFYVEYVPVSAGTDMLAPTDDERDILEKRINGYRKMYDDMIFIAFPGDEKYTGGCLAAGRGFFYIDPNGEAQPCPFSPHSDTSLKDKGLLAALQSPLFMKLQSNGLMAETHTGGCVLFGKENEVKQLL